MALSETERIKIDADVAEELAAQEARDARAAREARKIHEVVKAAREAVQDHAKEKKAAPLIVTTPPQPSDPDDIWPAVKKALIIVGITFAAKMALEALAARVARSRTFDTSPEPMAMPPLMEVTPEDDAKTSFRGIYLDAPPGAGSTSL